MRKILQAEFPKMELLWREVCKVILGKKKKSKPKKKTPPHSFLETNSTLQEIFLFCIETLC